MGLFGVGLGLDFMAYFYLGFADGLFGLHHLRLNLGLFGSFGDFFWFM